MLIWTMLKYFSLIKCITAYQQRNISRCVDALVMFFRCQYALAAAMEEINEERITFTTTSQRL